jgi:DNA (cytosine-5)-methyltransferase 1
MSIRKASLCSGYGGLDMATPGTLAWYAENDRDASSIMEREHPGMPNLSDITSSDLEFPEYPQLLLSGDPCQSLSAAGLRLGRADPRYLWPYVAQIIARLRPDEIFMENVQNIVSMEKGIHLAERIDTLTELGYEIRWTVLGACAVGAPHHRHRWFLRARRTDRLWAPDPVRVAAKCGAPRGGSRQILPTPRSRDWKGGSLSVRPIDGGPDLPTAIALLPTPTRGSAVQAEHWGKFADAIALWEQITGRPAPCPTEHAPRGGRRLNAELSEWMMGLEPGFITKDRPRNEALKRIGNGVVPLQARMAWDLLEF